jgi:hypothetical protein
MADFINARNMLFDSKGMKQPRLETILPHPWYVRIDFDNERFNAAGTDR